MAATVHEFDPDQVHDEIATLRGMVDKLNEVIGTFTGGTIQATDDLVATDPVDTRAAETWHTLGTLSNYAVTTARFRMTPEGNVEYDIGVNGNGSNVVTTAFSVTIPTQYRPSVTRRATMSESGRAITATDQWPTFVVNTTGVVQVLCAATGVTTAMHCNVTFPLDN